VVPIRALAPKLVLHEPGRVYIVGCKEYLIGGLIYSSLTGFTSSVMANECINNGSQLVCIKTGCKYMYTVL
jgi:hypothetical protein